jgi:quercetin dioxygenase-like cupin family protein
MLCPECGAVVPPGPLDPHRAEHGSRGPFRRLWSEAKAMARHPNAPTDRQKEEITMALHHAASGEVLHLRPGGSTAALVKTPSFETIHLVVKAGESIPPHKVAGAIMLDCIDGAVAVDVDGKAVEMTTRDWLHLDPGVPHALNGHADTELLLTILLDQAAPPPDSRR